MRKLRRFIWYLAGRLLLITVLLGLFTVTFYYAMNASNIYIVLKDGMAKIRDMMSNEERMVPLAEVVASLAGER